MKTRDEKRIEYHIDKIRSIIQENSDATFLGIVTSEAGLKITSDVMVGEGNNILAAIGVLLMQFASSSGIPVLKVIKMLKHSVNAANIGMKVMGLKPEDFFTDGEI